MQGGCPPPNSGFFVTDFVWTDVLFAFLYSGITKRERQKQEGVTIPT